MPKLLLVVSATGLATGWTYWQICLCSSAETATTVYCVPVDIKSMAGTHSRIRSAIFLSHDAIPSHQHTDSIQDAISLSHQLTQRLGVYLHVH